MISIGFKGGLELAHQGINIEVLKAIVLALIISIVIPVYSFFMMKSKLGVNNAAAIAAAYGSVSAVTFVTAVSFLDLKKLVLQWVYGGNYGYHGSTCYCCGGSVVKLVR